jgi:hypothetical protein
MSRLETSALLVEFEPELAGVDDCGGGDDASLVGRAF